MINSLKEIYSVLQESKEGDIASTWGCSRERVRESSGRRLNLSVVFMIHFEKMEVLNFSMIQFISLLKLILFFVLLKTVLLTFSYIIS